jgi:hypothetical protein
VVHPLGPLAVKLDACIFSVVFYIARKVCPQGKIEGLFYEKVFLNGRGEVIGIPHES